MVVAIDPGNDVAVAVDELQERIRVPGVMVVRKRVNRVVSEDDDFCLASAAFLQVSSNHFIWAGPTAPFQGWAWITPVAANSWSRA